MITTLVAILSMGLGSSGILFLINRLEYSKLDYIRKTRGIGRFMVWLISANCLFFFYFILNAILYNQMIVNSDFSEEINGSAGGFFTSASIADKYFNMQLFLTWLFIMFNTILFLIRFYLKPKANLVYRIQAIEKKYLIFIFFITIITCFISMMLFVILLDFSVSYEG